MRADDLDEDGIPVPADGLGTPGSEIVIASNGSEPGDSLAGVVLAHYPGRKIAPHTDAAASTVWASHAGVAHEEHTAGSVPHRQPTLDGSPTWSPGGPDAEWFAPDASTGALSWRSAPDHENPSDANADNVHILRPTARDADGGVVHVVHLVVGVSDIERSAA